MIGLGRKPPMDCGLRRNKWPELQLSVLETTVAYCGDFRLLQAYRKSKEKNATSQACESIHTDLRGGPCGPPEPEIYMKELINIVWAAGSEGYHVTTALRDFPESAVLAAIADKMQDTGLAKTYTEGMRRAVEVVEYFRHVADGATVCRQAHQKLQYDAAYLKSAPLVSLA